MTSGQARPRARDQVDIGAALMHRLLPAISGVDNFWGFFEPYHFLFYFSSHWPEVSRENNPQVWLRALSKSQLKTGCVTREMDRVLALLFGKSSLRWGDRATVPRWSVSADCHLRGGWIDANSVSGRRGNLNIQTQGKNGFRLMPNGNLCRDEDVYGIADVWIAIC